MRKFLSTYWQPVARVLGARSQEERAERAACLFALVLVAAAAIVRHVTGLTVHGAPFTLYGLAVAAAAARGGFLPAAAAALASILFEGLGAQGTTPLDLKVLFFAESLALAFLVSVLRSRLLRSAAHVTASEATISDLEDRARQARHLDTAFRHLEEFASEWALVVLDGRGTIVGWRTGAARLYGYPAEQVVGRPVGLLFAEPMSAAALAALLHRSLQDGGTRWIDGHRRCDGSRLDVEVEIRPLRAGGAEGFTLVLRDLAREREWEEYRHAAAGAHATLQLSADEACDRLAALESLTDPSLNPMGGAAMVTELLDRLRATTGADGAALVSPGRATGGALAARGLRPTGRSGAGETARLTPGRVELVQNDAARVGQLSAFQWPSRVASLLAVPVVHDGQVWSAIELVSERPRRVSDWDVALARIVADRLAPVVVLDGRVTAKAS